MIATAATLHAQQVKGPGHPINLADIDTTCAPCQNFYRFATGGWVKRTEIPAAFSSWSSFSELTDRNQAVVRSILESAARNAATTKDADVRKLGVFYETCMDSAAAERGGAQPIAAELDRISRIQTRQDLIATLIALRRAGMNVPFASVSTQHAKDSRRVILDVSQAGLGMPDRDYYTKTDSSSRDIRAAYRTHVAAILQLSGLDATSADAAASRVLALETTLANAQMTRLELRDPQAMDHFVPVAAADAMTPGFAWAPFLRGIGVRADSLNVSQPAFFATLARELQQRPLDDWKDYLRFHVANNASPWLSAAFARQNFAFSSKLSGAREMQPRWRRCLNMADGYLGDALGREYVKVAFTPEAKATMNAMIDNLLTVFRTRVQTLSWMSPETRVEALKKVGTVVRKVGYPDAWKDYTSMDIRDGLFFDNVKRARSYAVAEDFAKIGKPADRGEWGMTTPTVNAYSNPSNNEIVFPGGRLQPPFFHPTFDLAANYGGIGATIGHEASHGFDDQGRQYDAEGNLRDWWTADDARRFGELAAQLVDQYDKYTVLDTVHVNGKLTLGENIGDVSGVAVAYEALQLALKGKPRVIIDGFTPEQRFFLGWAQARRGIARDAAIRLAIRTDVHSPGEFRVNGPLSNMAEFAAAFGCKEGDAMYRRPGERVKIW
jgi:putative endopeptidase